ncbi:MAG: M15 family metallopeptidase [Jatrophihabitans sp.]|uniref:M15 family metallopeptidase n=1 Tax=Jatrophihabitans sp. TaxID=1932789 RepID=UPI003F7D4EF2
MQLAEALAGSTAPPDELARQCLVPVRFVDLTGVERDGELVADRALTDELVTIFDRMLEAGFPIAQVVPISAFDWDDDASMAANNTSCFNWRRIGGSDRWSVHSQGRAVDINPAFNPYGPDPATSLPPGSRYDLARPGTIGPDVHDRAGRDVLRIFAEHGWRWLGDDAIVDRHHFEKPR